MIDRWVEASAAYLGSARARESLAADPYWPKWDSPWWHMTLLWELGRVDAVPLEAAEAMLDALAGRYLDFFPNPREPLPPGKDPHRDSLCHCALATMAQVLFDRGLDPAARLPWLRGWFLRYQLPDGGLNCDEAVYAAGGSSSVQSTVPALEAMLRTTRRPLTPAEEEFVDRAAGWLIERRLAYRKRDGRPMDEEFLKIVFPRFYDYDLLRGLGALAEWRLVRGGPVPDEAVSGAMRALAARFPDGIVRVERPAFPGGKTLARGPGGAWERGRDASGFPLLESCRRPGAPIPALTRAWAAARSAFGHAL